MSRQQFDTVVPAPRTKATDAEHTYVNNTVMHNSFEPYENVDFSVSKPHTVQSNQKGAKLPVPQVRSSAPASKKNQTLRVNMEDNPNEAAAESVSSVTSVESVQSKPRIAPSPNTRRKTLQETLNTQVAVDSQVRRYGGLRYMNISKATPDDHDYENSWIFQRKEENDDSSSYQNINMSKHFGLPDFPCDTWYIL
ncbi:hypothetical protein EB796_024633 [Bugula neritina]|uniref:Uncharacterized protein n=1 Tax=Bugula neritina TaxID=10212 RepID=A0A7J7IT21_BUGNE|nr:hypothetical protein EB796_024633 [Bugula neritina]